ncbi:helix-turn-helix domain-containing protein [Paraburkholderia sp. JHI869]|uniref:GlxA family transcriptional regulator n=1 Tax=Paraburkholderia sp. JHI869 TaxID=3112959 RepID=UPI0031782840
MGDVGAGAAERGNVVSGGGWERSGPTRRIGVLLYKGFSLLSIGVVPEIFHLANEIAERQSDGGLQYQVQFFSAHGGDVECSSSVNVWTQECDAATSPSFDALFIADGRDLIEVMHDDRVCQWLRMVAPSTKIVFGIGKAAALIDALRLRADSYHSPQLPSTTDSPHAKGPTSRGNRYEPTKTALMLVGWDLGPDAVRDVSRRLSANGFAALTPLVADARADTAIEKVRASARWLKENCDRPISVSDAVNVSAMSERNFLRCFKQEMGVTPSEYLLQARLDLTSRMLAETDLSIDNIAKRCGWTNGDRLAKIFRRRFSLTPSEFRKRDRGAGGKKT